MPHCQLYYHIVWATKGREPLLCGAVREEVWGVIRSKAVGLGAVVHAVGGVADHVHLVVEIPPRVAVATLVGQVKGVSAAVRNKGRAEGEPALVWQAEYGAFTFDRKSLAAHVRYVEGQETHHGEGSVVEVLETVG